MPDSNPRYECRFPLIVLASRCLRRWNLLNEQSNGALRSFHSCIIIVGRNRTAAETIFAALPPAGTFAREFILMRLNTYVQRRHSLSIYS